MFLCSGWRPALLLPLYYPYFQVHLQTLRTWEYAEIPYRSVLFGCPSHDDGEPVLCRQPGDD